MKKAALIIVNGLPASGKTTLARRLGADVSLPVFSRDGMYETLYDAFDCRHNGEPPLLGQTSFTMLYYVIGSLLAAGRPLIVEGFFGRPELRSAEFQQLQTAHGFEPLQIVCRANGEALLQRIVERAGSRERHVGHHDLEHLAANKERILQGDLVPLVLGGQLIKINTTTPDSFDYAALLQQVREALSHCA